MITELAYLPLLPGQNPADPGSDAGKHWQSALNTLDQQPGQQHCYWGIGIENPDILYLYVDWDDVSFHEQFMNSSVYKPFIEQLGTLIDLTKISLCHFDFGPTPASAALKGGKAPVAEMFNSYFPEDYPESDRTKTKSVMQEFGDRVLSTAGGTCHAVSIGWAREKLAIPGTDKKGLVIQVLIAWDSKDAHMAFRETQHFKDCIGPIRNLKDVKERNAFHVALN